MLKKFMLTLSTARLIARRSSFAHAMHRRTRLLSSFFGWTFLLNFLVFLVLPLYTPLLLAQKLSAQVSATPSSNILGKQTFLPSLHPHKLPSQYLYDTWTSESGTPTLPPDVSPVSIAQTRDGYVWIATASGLLRFDGARFVLLDTSNTPTLRGNDIKALYAAPDGALWIGTGGNGLIRYWKGAFTQIISETSEQFSFVRSVHQDSRGIVWVGTLNGLVRLQESASGEVSTPEFVRDFPPVEISAITEDRTHAIWIGTQQDGVFRINNATAPISPSNLTHFTRTQGLADEVITALAADSVSGVWIGTASQGVQRFVNGAFSTRLGVASGLSSDAVSCLLVNRLGVLWIGTSNGLNRYTGSTVNNGITTLNTSNSALSSNTILSLAEDYEGSMWMAAGGSGIDRIKDPKFTVWGKKEGLHDDIYSTALQDRSGALWLGSFYNTGLTRLTLEKAEHFDNDGKNGTSRKTAGIPQGAFVRAIAETRSGTMLFGTTGLGIIRYENGVFSHIVGSEGIAQNTVRAIYEDSKGTVWIGTFGAGLYRLEGKTLVPAFSTANGLSSDFIVAIAEDKQERLWLATRDGGVCILTPHSGQNAAQGAMTTLTQKNGLPSNTVLYVARDNDGVMWIGTQFGIALCPESSIKAQSSGTQNITLTTLSRKNGLAEDVSRWMIHDSRGDYYLSGLGGITMIPKEHIRELLAGTRTGVEVRRYGKSDGMRSVECNGGGQPAACTTRDGALWFPTMKGMVSFHTRRLVLNTIPPPVAIEDLIANEKKTPFALGEIPKLPPRTERITIRYTALSLLFPDNVAFRYRLDGLDEDWIDVGQRREAYYTNLPPSEYTFRVQARNNDGVWNDVGASLSFAVKPRFYRTWWFYCLSALAIVGGVWGFLQWRVRLLQERERVLAKLVDDRTAEIQRQMHILDEQATEIELRNSQLQEKNLLIEEERQKSEMLLLNILPPKIAERLKKGEKIIADKFDSVTVLFADIVGFTNMSARVSPEHLVENLSMIFTTFDLLAAKYKLEKIKTIGDAYMLVGGLPEPTPNHTAQVIRMALDACREIQVLTEDLDEKISIRIGVQTGPVVAGVIGMRKFAYDLWGDAVNTASRMESTGEARRVHCTEDVYLLLKNEFDFEERGTIEVKGKGQMKTYFVLGEKAAR